MSQSIEQQTESRALLLDEKHRLAGARFAEREGYSLPASYGDAGGEYAAVRGGGAGLVDLSPRGRISLRGAEAVMFLNGLITNDVKTLERGRWMKAIFPNVQGRLLASVRVIHTEDGFLIDTEPETRGQVFKLLERFNLAGDFKAEDVSDRTAQLSLQGQRALEVAGSVLDQDLSALSHDSSSRVVWQGQPLTLIRATHTREDGLDLFPQAEGAAALWDALTAAGARPFGYDALEILRIEAGVPRFHLDMDETTVVLETGLDEAVSFTKGCYIGQEIIARIHWRGHVAKRLAGLSLSGAEPVPRDSRLISEDGKEVGRVTSSTFSPQLGHAIALGYVKYDYLRAGTRLLVRAPEEEREARLTELPFVRSSWDAVSREAAEDKG